MLIGGGSCLGACLALAVALAAELPLATSSPAVDPSATAPRPNPPELPAIRVNPKRKPSPDNPLFLFQGPQAQGPANSTGTADATAALTVDAFTRDLPPALRAVAAIQVAARCCSDDGSLRMAVWRSLLDGVRSRSVAVPLVLQVADPGEQFTMPLDEVEQLVDDYSDLVIGLELAEVRLQRYTQFGGDLSDTPSANARNFANVIELAAARGLLVFGQIDFLRFTHLLADRTLQPLLQTIRNNSASVVPICEMVAPNFFSRHTSVMGLLLSDAVDAIGLEAQSWFWQNSGAVSPGLFDATDSPMGVPSRWYGPMILLAAATGASVLSFEPEWDLWSSQTNFHVGQEVIFPMLQRVLEQSLIASKEEVLQRTQVAYQVSECETLQQFHEHIRHLDAVSAEGFLSQAAYGIWWRGMSYEVTPDIHRYFFVPVLPYDASTTVLRRFHRVFHVDDASSVAEWTALLEAAYPNVPEQSTAFVADVGAVTYAIHTRENLYERQTVVLSDVAVPVPAPNVSLATDACSAGEATSMSNVSWDAVPGANNFTIHAVSAPAVPSTTASGWMPMWDEFSFSPIAKVNASTTSATVALPCVPNGTGVASVVVGVTAEGSQLLRASLNFSVNYLGYHAFRRSHSPLRFVTLVPPGGDGEVRDVLAWPGDQRPQSLQSAWPLFPGVNSTDMRVAEAVASAVDALAAAHNSGDWRNTTSFYSASYCDPNGFGREYVGRAYKWWFSRYEAPFMYYQDRSWDFGGLRRRRKGISGSASPRHDYEVIEGSTVKMCAYLQMRSVSVWDLPWDDHGLMRIPRKPDKVACITWRLEPAATWRILTTDPALPNFEEILWNSRGYAEPHTLQPGVDEAFEPCVLPT